MNIRQKKFIYAILLVFVLADPRKPCVLNHKKTPAKTHSLNASLVLSSQTRPASLSFFIADIKLTENNEIKILELGPGIASEYKGYTALNKGRELMSLFWEYLKSFNIPVWLNLHLSFGEKITNNFLEHYDIETFKTKGFKMGRTKSWCEMDMRAALPKNTAQNFNHADIASYSGIYIDQGVEPPSYLQRQNQQKDHPTILYMDMSGSVLFYTNHKFLLHDLLSKQQLDNSTPQWRALAKHYDPNSARQILRHMPAEEYIIKPAAGTKGMDIIIVPKNKLDTVLKNILPEKFETVISEDDEDETLNKNSYTHWDYQQGPVFLVEACEHSKPVRVNKNKYDGTIRVAFAVQYSRGKTRIHFLDSYWKLPPAAIGKTNNKQSVVSDTNTDNNRIISAELSANDKKTVYAKLETIFTKIYEKMISTQPHELVDDLLSSNDKAHIAYAIHLLSFDYYKITEQQLQRLIELAETKDDFFHLCLKYLIIKMRPSQILPLIKILSHSHRPDVKQTVLKHLMKMPDPPPEITEIIRNIRREMILHNLKKSFAAA